MVTIQTWLGGNNMSKTHLQESYDYLFRLVHTSEDWIAPLLKAVETTPFEIACYSPGKSVASIWEISAHVTGWMEDLLHDLTGSPDAGSVDWPPVLSQTPFAWTAQKQHLKSLVLRLQDVLSHCSEEDLMASPPGTTTLRHRRLSSILVHNAYHAGQIIKLKQLYHASGKDVRLGEGVTAE